MLKNKLKIIALLAAIILALMIPIVRAENESADQTVENTDQVMAINEEGAEQNSSQNLIEPKSQEDNFKKSDVYLIGEEITIDYIVDGNLFVIANTVNINSQIGGDAFICANNINVGEQGYIFSNLFAISQNVNIYGVVYDLYAMANDVTINGYVYRDIRVGTETLNINGTIGRNAFVDANAINFAQASEDEAILTSVGIINGDLNYSSSKEISIPEGAVDGSINFTEHSVTNSSSTSIQDYILELGTFVATVAIIWLLCLWLAPKFLNNINKLMTEKLLPVIGFGLLTPVAITIAFIILLILGITTKIALLSLGVLFLLLAISSSVSVISINNLICKNLKIEKRIVTFGMLIASSVVIWLLTLIPYVGGLISFVISVVGLGIIVTSIIPVKTKNKEKTPTTNTEN